MLAQGMNLLLWSFEDLSRLEEEAERYLTDDTMPWVS